MKLASLLLWAAFVKRAGLSPTDYAVLYFICGNYNDKTGEAVIFMSDIQDRFDWICHTPGCGLDQAYNSVKRLEKYSLIRVRNINGRYHIRFVVDKLGAGNGEESED